MYPQNSGWNDHTTFGKNLASDMTSFTTCFEIPEATAFDLKLINQESKL